MTERVRPEPVDPARLAALLQETSIFEFERRETNEVHRQEAHELEDECHAFNRQGTVLAAQAAEVQEHLGDADWLADRRAWLAGCVAEQRLYQAWADDLVPRLRDHRARTRRHLLRVQERRAMLAWDAWALGAVELLGSYPQARDRAEAHPC